MSTFGGFLILFSFFVLGRAGFEAWTGTEDAWSTAIVGLFFLGLGFWLAVRAPLDSVAISPPGPLPKPAFGPSPPAEAVFSIVQTGDDAALDRARAVLEHDPRIRTIVEEGGRWYATPDRDDLPEWYALRLYCDAAEVDLVMAQAWQSLQDSLGPEQTNKLSMSRYS